ncbi:hypothetical protein DGWBC_0074 [Dehalogenimonas sp. WBC-2]|nr:hypothetical protein DGWBC_0074 [Dehalogenimonas sp. WBC-2]
MQIFAVIEFGGPGNNRPDKMPATYDYFITGNGTLARVLMPVTDFTQRL